MRWSRNVGALCLLLLAGSVISTAVSASVDDEFDDVEEPVEKEFGLGAETFVEAPVPKQIPGVSAPAAAFAFERYKYEVLAVTGLVLYVLVYLWGRSANARILDSWYSTCKGLIGEQFAEHGIGADPGSVFLKESDCEYKMFASGRRFCQGALITLDLCRRQDLASWFISLVYPEEDLTIDVPMANDTMDTFVVALCRRRKRKTVHEETRDLKDYAGIIPPESLPAGFPKQLAVLSDSREATKAVFPPRVVETLNENIDLVRIIHVTDQSPRVKLGTLNVGRRALRFQFHIPPPGEMESLLPLLRMVFWMIDHTATNVKLSPAGKKAGQLLRKEVLEREHREMHEERQERLRERKAEKLRAEEEEYQQLTPEQKRRWDEREEKKKAKERQRRSRPKMKRM